MSTGDLKNAPFQYNQRCSWPNTSWPWAGEHLDVAASYNNVANIHETRRR